MSQALSAEVDRNNVGQVYSQDREPAPLVLIEPGDEWNRVVVGYAFGDCSTYVHCDESEPTVSLFELAFRISVEGRVFDPTVESSCGPHTSTAPLIKAVRSWRFNPAVVNHQYVATDYACAVLQHSAKAP